MEQKPLDPKILNPGDIILYHPDSFFGYAVAIKTSSWICHVEIYWGLYRSKGFSVASREKFFWQSHRSGVDKYPLRLDHIAAVLRPPTFDRANADEWLYHGDIHNHFQPVILQPYDYWGLLVFEDLRKHGNKDKQWCSNFATRYLRRGGYEAFRWMDADHIAPVDFLKLDDVNEIYSNY